MTFPALDSGQPINDSEKTLLSYWKDNSIFQKSIDERSPRREFVFFDGPPFATGTPHYGHILAGTIKDAIPRYWSMKGYRVERKFGWDCHGVPVEFQVEKEHAIGGKPGIEKMGVGPFNELCRSIVLRCRDEWESTVERMGRFVDFENDYKTMDHEFMESVWWVFSQLWDKGLIYEGSKVISYSPKLGTPLSNFEAGLNYKDIDDPAVTLRFELTDEPGTYFLAWTTTPWTLPFNVGVGLSRDAEYVKIEKEGSFYWLAEARATKYFGEDFKVIERKIGKDFLNTAYVPLFPFFQDTPGKRYIALHDEADYVSMEDGTGIVHFACTFGAEDAELCARFEVYGVDGIDLNGYFDETIPELTGKYFRNDPEVPGSEEDNANMWVLNALKESGKLFLREQIRHSYPHCWRTDCALMYRGIKTWFVNVKKIKEQMIAKNKEINWLPDHLRDGRFGKLLESAPDWAISRNRFWGAPIPVWRCEDCGHIEVIHSREALEKKVDHEVADLHKHFVDDLSWPCDCGKSMKRIPEVLDCWFESGSMPYGSRHYPFSGKEFQPADFIAEGLDQTRGWFYSLHVLGVALFDQPIYKNVITNGIILAEDGAKMSKSKKNYPDPGLVFEKYGADAVRFYLLNSPVARGENLRFAEKGVEEVLKSVILPLRSAYQFFSTYANIDGWKPTKVTCVRHGESDHNVSGIYSGEINNQHFLTETGKAQAKETAQRINNFDALYHSPFHRTQQTAEIIARTKNFQKEMKADDRLCEYDFGQLEGLLYITPEERINHPEKYGAESPRECRERMKAFFQEITQKHRGQNICIVSHGGPIRQLEVWIAHATEGDLHHLVPEAHTGTERVFFPHPNSDNELDQWILSETQSLLTQVRESFDGYNLEGGLRHIPEFIDKLNNWYLRRSRKRFWAAGLNEDKRAGYETLHYVLLTLSKLLAPVCPFFTEKLYQDLTGGRSVHLEHLPHPQTDWIDPQVEAKVSLSRDIVSLAAGIRANKKIKLRQPLGKLRFMTTQKIDLDLDLIREEANVKEVEVLESVEGLAQAIIRVNAKKVGRKFGAKVQELIKAGKSGDFEMLEDGRVKIAREELEADEYERGFICEEGIEADASPDTVVILDTELSEDLKTEGYARELIRAIQDQRKQNNFNISDHISISYKTDSEILQKAFTQFGDMIAAEVLAESITSKELSGEALEVDGESMKLNLTSL